MGNGALLPERTIYISLNGNRGIPGPTASERSQFNAEDVPNFKPTKDSVIAFNRRGNRQATMSIPRSIVPQQGTGQVLQIHYNMSFGSMAVDSSASADRGSGDEGHAFLNSTEVPRTWDTEYTLPIALRTANALDHFGNGTNLTAFLKNDVGVSNLPTKPPAPAPAGKPNAAPPAQFAPGWDRVGSLTVSTVDGPSVPPKTNEVPLIKSVSNQPPKPVQRDFFRTQRTGINYGVPPVEEIQGTVLQDSGYQRQH